jgi:DNA-binding MarR family transcriptional regulator
MNWTEQLAHLTRDAMTAKQMTDNTETGKPPGFLRKAPGKAEKLQWKYAGIREWQAELSISRLFRTSIRLQTAFDRCFSQFGMTAQEAAALLHCTEEGETSAGKLAATMARNKGKITRFVDRLETAGFLKRKSDSRDHRLTIITATSKGRRVAPHLKARFDKVRNQFFEGVQNVDIGRLETLLHQLHANAEHLCDEKQRKFER